MNTREFLASLRPLLRSGRIADALAQIDGFRDALTRYGDQPHGPEDQEMLTRAKVAIQRDGQRAAF